jgi:hypothetical protein
MQQFISDHFRILVTLRHNTNLAIRDPQLYTDKLFLFKLFLFLDTNLAIRDPQLYADKLFLFKLFLFLDCRVFMGDDIHFFCETPVKPIPTAAFCSLLSNT